MKKTIAVLFALLSAAVFAGANDLLVLFYTKGPDTYADGKAVLENECYALVYTKDGKQDTVLVYPGAKDGKCPPVLFTIDEGKLSDYQGGEWGVYLLDTRDFAKDASGETLSGVDDKTGLPKLVNVKAEVGGGIASVSGFKTAATSGGVAAGSYDLAEVPQPTVTGIKVVGANVVVTVANTVPFIGYTLKSGSDVKNFAVPEGAATLSGDAAKEINLVTPKKDGAQFFKVSTIK